MKKQFWFLLGGALIVAALTVIAWFLIAAPAPTVEDVTLTGCWKVCKENNVTVSEEYILFEEGSLTFYRAGQPYFEGAFAVKGKSFDVKELGKRFEVNMISEHQMTLTNDGNRRELIRVDGIGAHPEKEELTGDWQVVMQAGKAVEGEVISFGKDALCDYRDGKLYVESAYTYDKGIITVEKLQTKLEAYTDGQTMLLYELEGGYVWEMERAEG